MPNEGLYLTVIILGILIVILIVIYASIRNKIVLRLKETERNKALVDTYLKKRFDLIPNLVDVCKGYVKFEQDTLNRLMELRLLFNNNPNSANANNLKEEYQKLIGVIEKYPNLKASDSFLDLQKQITNVENEIQATRRIYINSITNYNNTVLKFPTSIIATLRGNHPMDLPKYDYGEIKIEF